MCPRIFSFLSPDTQRVREPSILFPATSFFLPFSLWTRCALSWTCLVLWFPLFSLALCSRAKNESMDEEGKKKGIQEGKRVVVQREPSERRKKKRGIEPQIHLNFTSCPFGIHWTLIFFVLLLTPSIDLPRASQPAIDLRSHTNAGIPLLFIPLSSIR